MYVLSLFRGVFFKCKILLMSCVSKFFYNLDDFLSGCSISWRNNESPTIAVTYVSSQFFQSLLHALCGSNIWGIHAQDPHAFLAVPLLSCVLSVPLYPGECPCLSQLISFALNSDIKSHYCFFGLLLAWYILNPFLTFNLHVLLYLKWDSYRQHMVNFLKNLFCLYLCFKRYI